MKTRKTSSAKKYAGQACLTCLIALHGCPAGAEEGSTDTPAAERPSAMPKGAALYPTVALPPVQVTAPYDNGLGISDAASQGTVLGASLQDIPLLRPGEVLESVPGMVVTQHSGDGKANQYFLRGYNLDHGTDFAIRVDGVPVNMPTSAHGQGYADVNFLIPELIQRLDYRKGPYDAGNGDFSAAGSADIDYHKTLEHPFASWTFGSHGYRRALLAGSFRIAQPHGIGSQQRPVLLAAVEGLEENGPWRHPEALHKINGLLRLSSGDASRGWAVDGMAYRSRWNATDQVPLSLIQSGQLCRYCALDPTDGGSTARYSLSGEWHTHAASSYTEISAYLEHYRLGLFSNFTYFQLRPASGDQFEQAEARNAWGGAVAHGWLHPLWGHDSTTELGFQLRRDAIRVGLFDTKRRVPFDTVDDDRVRELASAMYVQNTTSWSNWFRSVAGLRVDNLKINVRSLSFAQNSGSTSSSRISPKLSLIFGPWRQTEFYINAGKGFHSNDARGVIDKVDPTTGLPSARVPSLVSAFGEEIGVRTQAIPRLQSTLALWRLDAHSELVYNADASLGSTTPNGASRRYGVEWNNHFALNDWLLLDADAAYTHARYAHANENGLPGQSIPNAVRKVGSVGLSVHDIDGWSGSMKLRYVGRYPLSQQGDRTAPSSVVTDLHVQHKLGSRASLALDVLNLFGRRYYDIAYSQGYRVSPRSPAVLDGVTVHPGEPREFRLTLQLNF